MIAGLNEPRYALLKAEEAGSPSNDEDSIIDSGSHGEPAKPRCLSSTTRTVYCLVLVGSLLMNLLLGLALYNLRSCSQTPSESLLSTTPLACPKAKLDKTPYAGLEYNVNGTWEFETPYAQEEIAAADKEWMAVDISNAFVSLTKDHAKRLGLPPSLPFPWDAQRKDLYLVSSIHSMHCLTVLHRSNLEYRTNHTQTYATEHVLHCLDNLRVDIQCSADDTPRFIPPDATESTVKTGVGQIRQCRSWSKLNSWAKEHSACFKYNQFLFQELSGNKVYPWAWQFCEKDSEYLPTVQKFLHKGSDWIAPPPGWPDIDEIQHHP